MSHKVLLKKLITLGLSKKVVSWFASFLGERTQRSLVNRVLSAEGTVPFGVPHRLVIGPLLFISYVDEIFKVVENSHVLMFADDLALAALWK